MESLKLVEFLIERGVDLTILNGDNQTPLTLAIESKKYGIAEYLLQCMLNKGIHLKEIAINLDQNVINLYLYRAALENYPKMCDFFIEKGANINSISLIKKILRYTLQLNAVIRIV
ncbi:MAG: ankyrin repeat domain-containing protein [Gammaproteobacteria bacterium]|nr:ankyrin repeat domain-containing protein [Gammaproteobacteria bacterium]MCW5582553.1 ankyrin repeat domain-containing protein [Gammaproteobacteria bacterium]